MILIKTEQIPYTGWYLHDYGRFSIADRNVRKIFYRKRGRILSGSFLPDGSYPELPEVRDPHTYLMTNEEVVAAKLIGYI